MQQRETHAVDEKTYSEVLGELVVNHGGKVSSVVEDHVQGLTVRERGKGLLNAPLVLLLGLSLPGEDGHTGGGDSGGGMVLGGEDVAGRPSDLGTDGGQGLDKNSAAEKAEVR